MRGSERSLNIKEYIIRSTRSEESNSYREKQYVTPTRIQRKEDISNSWVHTAGNENSRCTTISCNFPARIHLIDRIIVGIHVPGPSRIQLRPAPQRWIVVAFTELVQAGAAAILSTRELEQVGEASAAPVN